MCNLKNIINATIYLLSDISNYVTDDSYMINREWTII